MKTKTFSLFCTATILSGCAQNNAFAQDRVAVWNPETEARGGRFKIDLPYLNQVTTWLQNGGVNAERVTAAQINDDAQFSAQKYAALFLPGDSFPKTNVAALQKFAKDGGILVALNGKVPFNVRIEPEKDGVWTMAPKEPKFAWQSGEIYFNALGMKYIYNPAKHDQGVTNAPSAIFKKYLPSAPSINQKLPSFWVVPQGEAKYYPLVRSQRMDGADTVPQIFIVQNGPNTGIVSLNEFWTRPTDEKSWPLAQQTVVALGKIARDLKSGALKLTGADAIELLENQPPPEPMRHRLSKGQINPEGAQAVARWGKFDGTSFELSAPLEAGKSLSIDAPTAQKNAIPRALMPGSSMNLALPNLGNGARFLRVRGAYGKSGATLKANFGDSLVIHETFTYLDASGAGNLSAPDLVDVPAEFHRVAFLPPSSAQKLVLSNPGTEPIYFDAVQIEAKPAQPRRMVIGLGAGFSQARQSGKTALTPEIAKNWGSLRATTRGQAVGKPDDPKRWDAVDKTFESYFNLGVPLEMLIEGTPPWAAISPERLKNSNNRPHTVAPDNEKYKEIIERMVTKYGDRIDAYEIWNEADSQQFFRGTHAEYIAFFKMAVPLIKRLDPRAKIISTGMAGFKEEFVNELVREGVMKDVDLFAFHPYAGKSTAWDVPFGQIEGSLMSNGMDMEIYCNESGFVWQPSEWFTTPPNWSPTLQAIYLDKATARLMANKLARLSVFHAGGDTHPFGLIDQNGVPRPAYRVFEDYLTLNRGTRLDVSLFGKNGAALSGIYGAASLRDDGTLAVVVNPSEIDELRPVITQNPSTEFEDSKGWGAFNGKASVAEGKVTLQPGAGQSYIGFSNAGTLDLSKAPMVEFEVSEVEKWAQLELRVGGKSIKVANSINKAGLTRVDLRPLLKAAGAPEGIQDFGITIRAGGKATVDYLRFLSPDGTPVALSETIPGALKSVGALVRVPLPKTGNWKASARVGTQSQTLPIQIKTANGQSWAEINLELSGRTVLTLSP